MKLAFQLIVLFVLIVPATVLNIIIWVFGGWTQKPYMHPNPVYRLLDLIN